MNFSEYYDDSDQKVREFYECPSPEDPSDHTRCCETESCCKLEHIDSVLGLDLKIAMIISLCVIVFCVFTGVVIIICCFAHQCPWYDTCSGSWDKDQSSIGKGPFLYYVRVKGWVGGIAKYLLFLTGVGGWFMITLT